MKRKTLWMVGGLAVVFCAIGVGSVVHSQHEQWPRQLVALDLPAPEIVSAPDDWLNTGGKSIPFVPGRVYVVHFWTFGCGNCKHNLPAYAQWQKDYANSPVTFIGIHTPETEKERDPKNVAAETKRLGITAPVVIDGHAVNWKRWQQQVWPTVYLVDKQAHVRYYWVGELEWEGAGGTRIMQHWINVLLQEPAPFVDMGVVPQR